MKADLIKLAASTLALASTTTLAAPHKAATTVQCYGLNTDKGTNSCGLGADEIAAANKAFKNQFAKSTPIDCAGTQSCASQKGFLGWISKASLDECYTAGGFTIEKDAKGTWVVKDKNGVK